MVSGNYYTHVVMDIVFWSQHEPEFKSLTKLFAFSILLPTMGKIVDQTKPIIPGNRSKGRKTLFKPMKHSIEIDFVSNPDRAECLLKDTTTNNNNNTTNNYNNNNDY